MSVVVVTWSCDQIWSWCLRGAWLEGSPVSLPAPSPSLNQQHHGYDLADSVVAPHFSCPALSVATSICFAPTHHHPSFPHPHAPPFSQSCPLLHHSNHPCPINLSCASLFFIFMSTMSTYTNHLNVRLSLPRDIRRIFFSTAIFCFLLPPPFLKRNSSTTGTSTNPNSAPQDKLILLEGVPKVSVVRRLKVCLSPIDLVERYRLLSLDRAACQANAEPTTSER